jgi:hypothetical protein
LLTAGCHGLDAGKLAGQGVLGKAFPRGLLRTIHDDAGAHDKGISAVR